MQQIGDRLSRSQEMERVVAQSLKYATHMPSQNMVSQIKHSVMLPSHAMLSLLMETRKVLYDIGRDKKVHFNLFLLSLSLSHLDALSTGSSPHLHARRVSFTQAPRSSCCSVGPRHLGSLG